MQPIPLIDRTRISPFVVNDLERPSSPLPSLEKFQETVKDVFGSDKIVTVENASLSHSTISDYQYKSLTARIMLRGAETALNSGKPHTEYEYISFPSAQAASDKFESYAANLRLSSQSSNEGKFRLIEDSPISQKMSINLDRLGFSVDVLIQSRIIIHHNDAIARTHITEATFSPRNN